MQLCLFIDNKCTVTTCTGRCNICFNTACKLVSYCHLSSCQMCDYLYEKIDLTIKLLNFSFMLTVRCNSPGYKYWLVLTCYIKFEILYCIIQLLFGSLNYSPRYY